MLLQIRWLTGAIHHSPFHSPRRLQRDAFGVLVKGDPKTENYGGSLMGFGVQTSPVGPGTKPQQGTDDGVGSLGAKAGLASHKSDSGLVFAVDASFRVPLSPNPGDAADNRLFLPYRFFSVVFCVMRSKNLQKWRH